MACYHFKINPESVSNVCRLRRRKGRTAVVAPKEASDNHRPYDAKKHKVESGDDS